MRVANRSLAEKCCNYEQETITLRLTVTQVKERLECQRAIMDKVLDDLRDMNDELRSLVDASSPLSVNFF